MPDFEYYLKKESERIGVNIISLGVEEGGKYINKILEKFTPVITSAHLTVGSYPDIIEIPGKYQDAYSRLLPEEPVYMFFSQGLDQTYTLRNAVIRIENGRKVGDIEIFNCYFLSNDNGDYLISVNEYTIQYKGNNPEWFDSLEKCQS